MTHYLTFSFLDASAERSSVTMHIQPITVGTISAVVSFVGVVREDLEALTLGTVASEKIIMDDTYISRTPPTDQGAQRELKWLVTYEGVTDHKLYQFEIPTADPSLTIAGTDLADITLTPWVDFITDIEFSTVRTPGSDTQAINFVDARLVGRNL